MDGHTLQISAAAISRCGPLVCGVLLSNGKQCGAMLKDLKRHITRAHKYSLRKSTSSRPSTVEVELAITYLYHYAASGSFQRTEFHCLDEDGKSKKIKQWMAPQNEAIHKRLVLHLLKPSIGELLPASKSQWTKVPKIVWVSLVNYTAVQNPDYFEDFTIPKVDLGMHTLKSQCDFFHQRNFSLLRKLLGQGFAFEISKQRRLHQSIVMLEILRQSHKRVIEYTTPERLKLKYRGNPSPSGDLEETVVYLDFDSLPEHEATAFEISSCIQAWSKVSGERIRLFPSLEELKWYNAKINDIRALDDVSARHSVAEDVDLGYRPVTCFGQRLCPLEGQKTVLKGSHSSETKSVFFLESHEHPSLHCSIPTSLANHSSHTDASQLRLWFHQEKISTLQSIGEFRVIIATVADTKGLRGRKPEVVSCIHTGYKGSVARIPFLEVSGCERFWKEIKPLNFQGLRLFAIGVFSFLRERADWREHFERLEIGARLDVGISNGPTRRFFVNEVTHLQQGCWFSTATSQPYLRIPTAIAAALNDYFSIKKTPTTCQHMVIFFWTFPNQ